MLPGSSLYRAKLLGEQGQGVLMDALGNEANWHIQLADRRLAEMQALQRDRQPASNVQMNRLLMQVDTALEASYALPNGERAQVRQELHRNLDEAIGTLIVEADALAVLQQTQNALESNGDSVEIAAVLPTDTPAQEPASDTAEQPEVATSATTAPTTAPQRSPSLPQRRRPPSRRWRQKYRR